MLLFLVRVAQAGEPLDRVFEEAAAEFEVPEGVLLALSWEASHGHASVVSEVGGGTGLFGLPLEGDAPSLAAAGTILDEEPTAIANDTVLQVRGAAALLRAEWCLAHPGRAPDPTDMLAWWDPVRAFSRSSSPVRQERFATYVFDVLEGTEGGGARFPAAAPPPAGMCDYAGCADFERACSDNYSNESRTGSDIDMIVIHDVEGSYDACISWFGDCSAGASAHYVVRSDDGEITQLVREEDIAWHAGDWDTNERSVGIEHEGYMDYADDYYTDAMYRASAALALDIAARTAVPLDRDHVIGHSEVPGCPSGEGGGASCHQDPGDGWDWDFYMSLLTGETAGTLHGIVAEGDIYNGARIPHAEVWIEGSGETCFSGVTGGFTFEDLVLAETTVWAEAPGFDAASCTVELLAGDNWCSIALSASESAPDNGDDTAVPADEDPTEPEVEDTAGADTGEALDPVAESVVGPTSQGCGCGAAPRAGSLGWLAGFALLLGGRRRAFRAPVR